MDRAPPDTRARKQRSIGLAAALLIAAATCQMMVAQTATPVFAGGNNHSLALLPNGTVKAWGDNGAGQLGIGTTPYTAYTSLQVPPASLSGVVAVAAGSLFSLALLSNGTVKSWGANNFGQLGLGMTTSQNTPQQIPASSLNNVIAIAAGSGHSLALLQNGAVMAWGWNGNGELGIGNTSNQSTPQQIPASSLNNVVAIAAGSGHSLALLQNGTVRTWGLNGNGELGLGNTMNHSTPQQIPATTLGNVVAVAAGTGHSLALHANSKVSAWGFNVFGQLGLGSTTNQTVPCGIPGGNLSSVIAVSSGAFYSIALLSDGTVKSWGYNNYGQLGIGVIPFPGIQATPQQIPASSLSNVIALAAGGNHSLALLSDGTAKSWGWNVGQLGIGFPSPVSVPTPQLIPGLCLSGAATYTLQFGPLGSSALGMTIPCNALTGALSGQHYYFNTFSIDSMNATSPGTGAWQGLHTTQAEVLTWLNLGTSGFTLALGPLALTGGASSSAAIAPASLSGLTVYGVSVAFHPVTLAVVANSPVASHNF